MPNWPAGCPQLMLTGIQDKKGDTRLRSPTDVGPAIVRRRYTAAVRNLDVPMTFSNTERQVFENFYSVDLSEGTFSFVWVDPLDGSSATLRFRETGGPSFGGVVGSNNNDLKRWDVTLALEILP